MPRLRRTVIAVVAVAAASVAPAGPQPGPQPAAAQAGTAPVVVEAFGGAARFVRPLDASTLVAAVGGRIVTLAVDDGAGLRPLGRSGPLAAAPRALAVAGSAADGGPGDGRTVALAALADGAIVVVDLGDPARPRLAGTLCLAAVATSAPPQTDPTAEPLRACDGVVRPREVTAVALRADGRVGLAAAGSDAVVFELDVERGVRTIARLDLGVAVRDLAFDGNRVLALGPRFDLAPDGFDRDSGDGVAVIDLGDPARPVRRGWLKLDGAPGWFGDLAAGSGAALAAGEGGGAVVDARAPDRPRLAARIDRDASAVAVGAAGSSQTAALAMSRAFDVARGEFPALFDDLALFDLTQPTTPRAVARHWTRRDRLVVDLALLPDAVGARVAVADASGITAYVAHGGALVSGGRQASGRARMVAIDDAGRAIAVEGTLESARLARYAPGADAADGALEGLAHPFDVAVAGDRAYVAESVGVRIVALPPEAPPHTIGYLAEVNQPFARVAAGGSWLALASHGGHIQIVDVTDPEAPRFGPAFTPARGDVMPDVAVDGDRLFVADAERLTVVSLADANVPRVVSAASHGVRPGAVPFLEPRLALADGRAWVADAAAGVAVYDVRGPQPQRLARWDDLGAVAIAAHGATAAAAVAPTRDRESVDPGSLVLLAAPWASRPAIAVGWSAPAEVTDLAFASDGTLWLANGDYGLTRWRPRDAVTATATSTAAPTLPPRPTATAAAPDPTRPFRAFLPLAVRAAGAAGGAPGALRLRRTAGGIAASVAIDASHAYLAEGSSIVALRIRGWPDDGTGPIVQADLTLDRPVRSLAAGEGWLAALLGPTTVLDAGLATVGAGDPSLQLIDVAEPNRPRAAGRVALPGAAVDVAVGRGATGRQAAVVGQGADGGYFALVDAADLDAPSAVVMPFAAGDVPLGVALDGARAVVQSARGATSALTLVDVGDPRRPSVLGTVGGLPPAVRAGAVAMRGGPAFAATAQGVVVADVTGSEPVPRGVPFVISPVHAFDPSLTQIAADGDLVWLLTANGILALFESRPSGVADMRAMTTAVHGDDFAVGRALAVSRDALAVAGGARSEAIVMARTAFGLKPPPQADGERDVVLPGTRFGLGGVYAVADGTPDDAIAYAAMADGRLQPVTIERDRPVALGHAVVAGFEVPQWPPDDAAMAGDLGLWVGPRTALRSHRLLGALSVALAEASLAADSERFGVFTPVETLRRMATQRRVAIADGFAWVSERSAGLVVFDLDDPTRLAPVGRMETPGQPRGLAVRDGWVFVADGTAGLTVLDARNPAAPFEAGHLALPGAASAVSLSADGKAAFVAVEAADGAWLGGGRDRAALWTIDVRQPTAPRAVDSVGLGLARVAGIAGDGRWRYVAGAADVPGGGPAVVAVDVAGAPWVAAAWRGAPGGAAARGVAVVGRFVVAALGVDGMAVLDAPR